MSKVISKLEWDSDFFGFNIAHLNRLGSQEDILEAQKFADSNHIRIIQAKPLITDSQYIRNLEINNFHLSDVYITYKCDYHHSENPPQNVRLASQKDLAQLKAIAMKSFKDTRYSSAIFGKKSPAMYAIWIEKAVAGTFDDGCLLSYHNDVITGLVTYRQKKSEMQIGLIAVVERFRGVGIGRNLLIAIASSAKKKNLPLVVVTSVRNYSAQSMYIKFGFLVEKVECWYYKIFDRYDGK